MSKPDDPTQIANAPSPSPIQQTKDPVPMGTPPPPYEPGKGLGPALVSNEEKLLASTSLKTALLEARKELSEVIKKEGEPQKLSWVEKVTGTKKAYNDDNNLALGKSPYEAKAASSTIATESVQTPTPKPQKETFLASVGKTPPSNTPPPSGRGPKR